MCKWGTYEEVECVIAAHLSYTGKERKKLVKIDKCIAPIVRALSEAGIKMVYSCCGHGKSGRIDLADGRFLIVRNNKSDWPYERCSGCGREQRLAWAVTDELWAKVIECPDVQKVLCLECFLSVADEKSIEVNNEDFTFLQWIGINLKGEGFRK